MWMKFKFPAAAIILACFVLVVNVFKVNWLKYGLDCKINLNLQLTSTLFENSKICWNFYPIWKSPYNESLADF